MLQHFCQRTKISFARTHAPRSFELKDDHVERTTDHIAGLTCHPLDDEGRIVMIETPSASRTKTTSVFVEAVGGQLRFDDGVALMHFADRGISLSTANHRSFAKSAAEVRCTLYRSGRN
jgi:hypothetical protein